MLMVFMFVCFEGSKVFVKEVMEAAGVPMVCFELFDDVVKVVVCVMSWGVEWVAVQVGSLLLWLVLMCRFCSVLILL